MTVIIGEIKQAGYRVEMDRGEVRMCDGIII